MYNTNWELPEFYAGSIWLKYMKYNREQYIEKLKTVLEKHVFEHSLAVEACMHGLYEYFKQQNLLNASEPALDDWLLAGLLHDVDYYGTYKDTHPTNTLAVTQNLSLELPTVVHEIIKAHAPERTSVRPVSKAQWSIFCADSLTGLIMAVAMIYPSRKLVDVKVSSVLKRFLKEPRFAAGTRRDEIAMCSNPTGLNLPIETFIEICLKSMQQIASDLGL